MLSGLYEGLARNGIGCCATELSPPGLTIFMEAGVGRRSCAVHDDWTAKASDSANGVDTSKNLEQVLHCA